VSLCDVAEDCNVIYVDLFVYGLFNEMLVMKSMQHLLYLVNLKYTEHNVVVV